MQIIESKTLSLDEIIKLYSDAGWINYLDRKDVILEAFKNSLYILGSYENDRLIGFIRVVGDGITTILIQDLIVLKEYQRKGVGTKLLETVLKKYKDVYQIQLLTDDIEKNNNFYKKLGLKQSKEIGCVSFVKYNI